MNLYPIGKFLTNIFAYLLFRFHFEGVENIPKDEGFIVASNHQGYMDPIFLTMRIRRPMHFMAKSEFFDHWLLGSLFSSLGAFPIQRGTADRSGLAKAAGIVRDGGVLCIFPEGTRSKDGNPMRAKPGITMLASQVKCGVLPVGISYKGKLGFRHKVTIRFGRYIPFDEMGIIEGSSSSIRKGAIMIKDGVVREMDKDCYDESVYWR